MYNENENAIGSKHNMTKILSIVAIVLSTISILFSGFTCLNVNRGKHRGPRFEMSNSREFKMPNRDGKQYDNENFKNKNFKYSKPDTDNSRSSDNSKYERNFKNFPNDKFNRFQNNNNRDDRDNTKNEITPDRQAPAFPTPFNSTN